MNQKQKDRLQEALDIISEVFEEEDTKLDNMSEKFSETQKYQDMEEIKDKLYDIQNELEEIVMN